MNADVQEVRAARVDEAEDVLQTLCAAFGLDADAARPIFYGDPFFDLTQKRILTDAHGEIVSCLTLIPANLGIGGVSVPMTGVAGVATRPECQNQGQAGTLLRETLATQARESVTPLAALFADRTEYYQKFGWETASRGVVWRGPASTLATDGGELETVRQSRPEDAAAIHGLHAETTKNQTGASVRDARRWRVIEEFAPGRETYICDDQSGYMLLERMPGGAAHVHEFCALHADARRDLLAFLSRQPGELAWTLGATKLPSLPPAADLQDAPGVMIRIVNLRDALSRLHAAHFARTLAETKDTLTIAATDALLPRNQTPLRLDASGVSEANLNGANCLHADIRVFARLLLGDITPSAAHAAGFVQISSPRALALADRLFPARHPFVAIPDQF